MLATCDVLFTGEAVATLGRPTTNVEAIIADTANDVTPNQAQIDALNQEHALYWRIAQSVLAQATGASTTTVAPTADDRASVVRSDIGDGVDQHPAGGRRCGDHDPELLLRTGRVDRARRHDADGHQRRQRSPHADRRRRIAPFDTGRIEPGASATITLDQPGTYTYHCNFHESMTGTIIVT